MPNKNENISHLNKLLVNELTASHFYLLNSKIIKELGIKSLSKTFNKEATEEMKHANLLIDRILSLHGIPEMQFSNKIQAYNNIEKIFETSLNSEQKNLTDLKNAIKTFEASSDFTSRGIAASILSSEEEHIEWLKQQLNLIKLLGIQNYLSKNI